MMLSLPTNLITKARGLTTGITGWASGYNWYKLGIKVVIYLGIGLAIHFHAIHQCEAKHNAKQAKAATAHATAVVAETDKRLPEVRDADTNSIRLRQTVAVTGDKLHEAIKATPTSGCNLSDSELQFYRELSEATKGK